MLKLVENPEDFPSNDDCLAAKVRDAIKDKYRKTNLGYKFFFSPKYMEAAVTQIATRDIRVTIREVTDDISSRD